MTPHPTAAEVAALKDRLADSERRLQLLLNASLDCVICADEATRITEFNAAAERVFRIVRSQALGKDLVDLVLPPEARAWHRQQLFTSATPPNLEVLADRIETTAIRSDGSNFPCEITVTQKINEHREFVVHIRDITAHKRSEEAMLWLAAIVESSEDAVIGGDLDGRIMSWNKGAEAMYGYRFEEISGQIVSILVAPDMSAEVLRMLEKMKSGQHIRGIETYSITKNGSLLNVWLTISPVQGADGDIVGISIIARNITDERRVQEALRTARDTSVYSSPIPIIAADTQGLVTVWNPAAAEVFGWNEKEVLGKPLPIIPPDAIGESALLHKLLLSGETLTGVEVCRQRKDGAQLTISLSASPLRDDKHTIRGIIGFFTDISDRKKTEEAWRRAEEKYRSIFENAEEGIYQATLDGKYISANPALARMLGFESAPALMKARNEMAELDHTLAELFSVFARSIEERGTLRNFEYEARRKDGKAIWLSASAHAVRNENGKLLYFEGTVQDITERRQLEQQLRQIQKMEAVGRLAGGVAHDFNNILMAISSYSELLGKLAKDDVTLRYVDEILKAVNRGSSVTQGLLTFSRKQVSSPRVLEINAVVAEQLDMLKRLIPENIDLTFLPSESVGNITADPTQIGQIVMNLVINARDAMPNGGTVSIETGIGNRPNQDQRTAPSSQRYVVLTISDNGFGMDAETKSHLFEPFYTTKAVGKGTGLGLATVFGIVKQSMGQIMVESDLGRGTTVKVFLPRTEEIVETVQGTEMGDHAANGETVLLVEDEAAVRESTAEYLTACGYTVLTAAGGQDALRIAEQQKNPINLLLTDLVMPGMSGRELSEKFSILHAEAKTVFMSGYSNNVLSSQQLLDPRHVLLQKPFQLKTLGECIRRALGRKNAAEA